MAFLQCCFHLPRLVWERDPLIKNVGTTSFRVVSVSCCPCCCSTAPVVDLPSSSALLMYIVFYSPLRVGTPALIDTVTYDGEAVVEQLSGLLPPWVTHHASVCVDFSLLFVMIMEPSFFFFSCVRFGHSTSFLPTTTNGILIIKQCLHD